jgi:hypothetical protein
MPSTHDQHPVQQLTTHSADPPLRERVRPWCPHGCAEDPDALGVEDGIEGVGELRVPIANQELEMLDVVGQLHEQVAGLLGRPYPGRVGGHPEDVDPAGGKLDHKQHVQALEQDRVDLEEVARQHALGLRGQELPLG